MTPRPLLALVLACAALAACDAQVDADHRGTPLAVLGGTVRNTRTLPVADAEVVVLWFGDSEAGDTLDAGEVTAAGTFPAQFTLTLYEPPPSSLYVDLPDGPIAIGLIVAGIPGTDYLAEVSAPPAGILGVEVDHMMVYAPRDIPVGSWAAYFLHGTLTAGFHLFGVHRVTEEERAEREACVDMLDPDHETVEIYKLCGGYPYFDDLVPLPDDLETPLEIELVDDPSTIQIPNWT